jgi:antitoxin CptB
MNTSNTKKLEWACRRGMLELDVLLNNFLKEVYPSLSEQDKLSFIELLTYQDPVLFDYLMGRVVPEDDNIAKIAEAIRAHAKSRI